MEPQNNIKAQQPIQQVEINDLQKAADKLRTGGLKGRLITFGRKLQGSQRTQAAFANRLAAFNALVTKYNAQEGCNFNVVVLDTHNIDVARITKSLPLLTTSVDEQIQETQYTQGLSQLESVQQREQGVDAFNTLKEMARSPLDPQSKPKKQLQASNQFNSLLAQACVQLDKGGLLDLDAMSGLLSFADDFYSQLEDDFQADSLSAANSQISQALAGNQRPQANALHQLAQLTRRLAATPGHGRSVEDLKQDVGNLLRLADLTGSANQQLTNAVMKHVSEAFDGDPKQVQALIRDRAEHHLMQVNRGSPNALALLTAAFPGSQHSTLKDTQAAFKEAADALFEAHPATAFHLMTVRHLAVRTLNTASEEGQLDFSLYKTVMSKVMGAYTHMGRSPTDIARARSLFVATLEPAAREFCETMMLIAEIPKPPTSSKEDYNSTKLNAAFDHLARLPEGSQKDALTLVMRHFLFEGGDHLGDFLKEANQARERGLALYRQLASRTDDFSVGVRAELLKEMASDYDDFIQNEVLLSPLAQTIANVEVGTVVVVDGQPKSVTRLADQNGTLLVRTYRDDQAVDEEYTPEDGNVTTRTHQTFNRTRVRDNLDEIHKTAQQQFYLLKDLARREGVNLPQLPQRRRPAPRQPPI